MRQDQLAIPEQAPDWSEDIQLLSIEPADESVALPSDIAASPNSQLMRTIFDQLLLTGTSGHLDSRAEMLTLNLGLIHDKLVILKLLQGYTMMSD